jgi:hypothetical protein
MASLSYRKVLHGCFVFVDHIRPRHGSIDGKTLFHRVTAEELECWAEHALRREIRHELGSEEVRVDALGNAGPPRLLFHQLPQSAG